MHNGTEFHHPNLLLLHCVMLYVLYVHLVWYKEAAGLKCTVQAISKQLLLNKQE